VNLAGEQLKDALASIAAWRIEPEASLNCPVCHSSGLSICDRSARPYAEWYVLTCKSCGLDATVQIPMRGPPEI
jgi:transcription elongation factor Elf1